MKARAALLGLILIGVGFGIGYYVRDPGGTPPAPPSAQEALTELVAYRGDGAPAARRVIEWVDAVVAGGRAMLPRLDEELGKAGHRRYATGTWKADPMLGVVSCHPTLRAALCEAVARIGGDRAVELLMREADRPGEAGEAWIERYIAFAFLVRHSERAEVREYLSGRVLERLAAKMDGPEMRLRIQVARPYLTPEAWGRIAGSFTTGWPERATLDELAETLFVIDRERAGRLFLKTLTDPGSTGGTRAAATRAVARLPERRGEALPIVLAHTDRSLIGWFIGGMNVGRFREAQRETEARESMDLDRMIEYTEGRVADLDDQIRILGQIRASIDDESAKLLRFDEWGGKFEAARDYGRQTLAALKKARAARGDG